MKTRVDERLRREAQQFCLRFACPHCVYFDAERDVCSEGYPTEEHRSERLDRREILFCKLFEAT